MSTMNLVRIERETGIRQRNVDLPAMYQKAIIAIKAAASLEELQNIANDAEAAAGYYKVWKDQEGEFQLRRIRTRAVIEMGRRLANLSAAPQTGGTGFGGISLSKRTIAMRAAGIEEAMGRAAVKANKVPEITRERMIKNSPPAGIYDIARVAPVHGPQSGRDRRHVSALLGHGSLFSKFHQFCLTTDAKQAARGIDFVDRAHAQAYILDIENWFHDFERHLPKTTRSAK